MPFNRIVLFIFCLMLGFGWAVTANAQITANQQRYRLNGGGGQLQIGGGLPLPIQVTVPGAWGGTIFPPLLIPVKPGVNPIIIGTTVMTVQQKITIPAAALSKGAAQLTLGQFGQNPSLYAVGTNLNYKWPVDPAILSTGARTGAKTTTLTTGGGAGSIRYSNPLASKFGGPAQFVLFAGVPAAGLKPAAPVTLYAIGVPGPGNPPCTHVALTTQVAPFGPFPGPGNPACVAGLALALPTGLIAAGGPNGTFISTPGGTATILTVNGATKITGPQPGVGIGKFGPNGTVTVFAYTGGGARGGTNMASSVGYPWTTGMITIRQNAAFGAPEVFTLTGMDDRTTGGAGTIQLVSGALSQRTGSGPNANRGWIRLELGPAIGVPALSPAALAATAGLMLLAAGYAMRRRLFA